MARNVDLGGSWAQFGRALGRSGPSCGHFWGHFGRFWWGPTHIFLKPWSKMGSQKPFGGILARFGRVLERILEGFGKKFVKILGRNLAQQTLHRLVPVSFVVFL